MISVLIALFPIAFILLLGKLLSAMQLLTPAGWIGIERVTYFVLFPALIIGKLAIADFSNLELAMPIALVAAQFALGGVSILIGWALKQPRERLGVFVQSAVRWNTFIALALAQEMMGGVGVALVVVAAAAMIPTANVLSVSALISFSNVRANTAHLVRQIAINPLVIACVVGITLNLLPITIPQLAFNTMDLLAQATIATGLLTTGAAIQLKTRSAPIGVVAGWSLLRLLGLPLIAGLLAIALGVSPPVLLAILIATSVPTASNGTILARQLGADAGLAANLIACQTVFSLFTISAILWISSVV